MRPSARATLGPGLSRQWISNGAAVSWNGKSTGFGSGADAKQLAKRSASVSSATTSCRTRRLNEEGTIDATHGAGGGVEPSHVLRRSEF